MASFLNNSGDIIIDATLTDVGREMLAKGDGSFAIKKFALADDEINYELYNTSAGTIYADLNILKTPIFEAATNNIATMKHKLATYTTEELLYLTTLKLNTNSLTHDVAPGQPLGNGALSQDLYVVLCTQNSVDAYSGESSAGGSLPTGFVNGVTIASAQKEQSLIHLDHGLDTTDISFKDVLNAELAEPAFLFQVDDRFAEIVTAFDALGPIVVDEDNVAHYQYATGDYGSPSSEAAESPIAGPRGPSFKFAIKAANQLKLSTAMFTKFGYTITNFFTTTGGDATVGSSALTDAVAIDSTVRITGFNTGARIDVPVRFIREA